MRRRLGLAVAVMMLAGCGVPPGDGGLWARQGLQQELVLSRLSDQQRIEAAHAFELRLADETLTREAARLEAALQDCPGAERQVLALSPANELRDGVRVRVADDPLRTARLANQALADWHLRRARASGSQAQCERARAALNGTPSPQPVDPLSQLGLATVTRAANYPGTVTDADPRDLAVTEYALGWTDTLRAAAPMPEYLAAVYGGRLFVDADLPAAWRGRAAEGLVDELAPLYPRWEPDAILQALLAR